jgi:hypothetical protein
MISKLAKSFFWGGGKVHSRPMLYYNHFVDQDLLLTRKLMNKCSK